MTSQKPFAPSADRNKQAILTALREELAETDRVFEVGSGTGQHLTHFAMTMPNVEWIPSDLSAQLAGIRQWIDDTACSNIHPPIDFDLTDPVLPDIAVSVVYTSNTFHIVSWLSVQSAFNCASALLDAGQKFIVYGPFSVNGQHTSQGNYDFDKQLRSDNSESGMRDLNDLNSLAAEHQFSPAKAVLMPANNQLLIWEKIG